MKKILAIGILAVTAIAFSQQTASAWVNSRFGIGMNWDWQTGGNSFGWGLYRNGQPPGGEGYDPGYHHHHGQPYGMTQPAPMPYAYDMPVYGPGYAQPMPMPMQPYAQPFQFATYPRPVYYYYDR
jgi:hypothetical protein